MLEDPVLGPQPQIDRKIVKSALAKMKKSEASALAKMKKSKAPGTSGAITEMLLASGDAGLDKMTSFFNCIL